MTKPPDLHQIVTMQWKDRVLLGNVVEVYRSEVRGFTHAKVRHFNGEMWPIEPTISAIHEV